MSRAQKMVVTGLGAMTPAFIAGDAARACTAASATIEPAARGAVIPLDQEALKAALLALTPTEKLRIAGDRIHLAAKTQNLPGGPVKMGNSCGFAGAAVANSCSPCGTLHCARPAGPLAVPRAAPPAAVPAPPLKAR